jgi:hypothetical protein
MVSKMTRNPLNKLALDTFQTIQVKTYYDDQMDQTKAII